MGPSCGTFEVVEVVVVLGMPLAWGGDRAPWIDTEGEVAPCTGGWGRNGTVHKDSDVEGRR